MDCFYHMRSLIRIPPLHVVQSVTVNDASRLQVGCSFYEYSLSSPGDYLRKIRKLPLDGLLCSIHWLLEVHIQLQDRIHLLPITTSTVYSRAITQE